MDIAKGLRAAHDGSSDVSREYIERIAKQGGEQTPDASATLAQVLAEVKSAGIVSAMAARESIAAHNSTFQVLYGMSRAQGALTELVAEVRLNGPVGGSEGGGSDAMSAAGTLASLTENPYIVAAAMTGGKIIDSIDDTEKQKQSEISQRNSLTNITLRAQNEAQKNALTAADNVNPPEDPLMNTNGIFDTYKPSDLLPYIGVLADASRHYEEAKQLYADHGVYERERAAADDVAALSQAAGAAKAQTGMISPDGAAAQLGITINMNNHFDSAPKDAADIEALGASMARMIADELARGAAVYTP